MLVRIRSKQWVANGDQNNCFLFIINIFPTFTYVEVLSVTTKAAFALSISSTIESKSSNKLSAFFEMFEVTILFRK